MVEFALVAPVLLLLVFAILQGALLINAQATLDNATREAARAAAICGVQKGTFVYRGTPYSSCLVAAREEFVRSRGILATDTTHLTLTVCAAPDATTGKCPAGTSSQASSVGGVVQVDASYNYDFYLDPLLGNAAPSVGMTSSARVVAQQ